MQVDAFGACVSATVACLAAREMKACLAIGFRTERSVEPRNQRQQRPERAEAVTPLAQDDELEHEYQREDDEPCRDLAELEQAPYEDDWWFTARIAVANAKAMVDQTYIQKEQSLSVFPPRRFAQIGAV